MKSKFLLMVGMVVLLISSAVGATASDYVVREFDNINDKSDSSITTNSVEATTENANFYDFTARMNIISGNSYQSELRVVKTDATDVSSYNYVNAWVYSPKRLSDSKLSFELYDSSTNRARYKISVDWIGWRMISIPASSFSNVDNVAYDKTQLKQLRFTTNYSDKTWSEESFLCVDKIWFSTDNPYVGSSDGVEANLTDNTDMTVNTDSGYCYKLSKNIRFNTKLNRSEGAALFSSPIDATGKQYVNMWIYSDKDMSYVDNDLTLVPNIRFSLFNSIDTYTCGKTDIKIDFSGWKLISIPLSKFGALAASGDLNINKMRFVANEDNWTKFQEACYLYIDKVWFSDNLPEYGMTQEVKTEAVDMKLRSFDDKLTLHFSDVVSLLDGTKIKLIKIADNSEISISAYPLSPNDIGISLNSPLDSDTEYKIVAFEGAVTDANGMKNPQKEIIITTAKSELKASAPVIFNGTERFTTTPESKRIRTTTSIYNTTNADKNVLVFIADYEDTGNTLKAVELKNVQVLANSKKTILTGTISSVAGDTVKAFVWDELYRPLSFTEQQ